MKLLWSCSALSLLLAGHGWADTRTIGAEECSPHSQPWQAGLFFLTRLFCGATLISDQWLLTAAHCLKPYLWVRLGEHHLWKWEGPEQLFRATNFFPHPGFNKDLSAHDHNDDIMLIRLPRPALLCPAVQPLNLSEACVSTGTQCLISGWGAVSSPKVRYPLTLQCANISILDPKLCHHAYPGHISDSMLCAGLWEGGRGSCQGDSGGPLVCDGTLAGVVSGGAEPCSRPRRPAVYTKVCHYVDWIRKTMEENSPRALNDPERRVGAEEPETASSSSGDSDPTSSLRPLRLRPRTRTSTVESVPVGLERREDSVPSGPVSVTSPRDSSTPRRLRYLTAPPQQMTSRK